LCEGEASVKRHDSHGERHNQAADDQSCFSGKVQWQPNVFPIEARLYEVGLLRFLPILNNPWNWATARRSATPEGQLLA
jgi:hypothetical protein